MASSANLGHDSAKVFSLRSSYTSSRRTTSFSSFSSSSSSSLDSSYFLDDSSLSPATPLQFSGVPFSWERLPGIPKKQSSKKLKENTTFLLPLPPPSTSKQFPKKPIYREKNSAKKKKHVSKQSIERDPFSDALVECSKDDGRRNSHRWNHIEASKVSTRSLGDRICSVGLYASCKSTCASAESIVHLPSSWRSSTSYYDLVHGRNR